MPSPAFGFSVGDLISAIKLINQVRKALKDVGGAASEYQGAVIELENLAATLSHLEAFQVDEDNVQHVNAIRAMALACRHPLEEFKVKIMQYESALGSSAKSNTFRAASKRVKWSVSFAQEVEKFRAVITAKHVSINLLLEMQISKSLSKGNTHMRDGLQGLEQRITEHRAISCSLQERTESIDNRIKLAHEANQERLESIHAQVKRVDNSVTRVSHLGQHIMDCLTAFSGRFQALLGFIIQSNLQTHHLLIQIQEAIPARPTNLPETNIRFEDALGEIKELPYEYFRHWEVFEGFLRANFRHKPGEAKILKSQYHLIDQTNNQAVIKKEVWSNYIREGAKVSMSMIIFYAEMQHDSCPRPGCSGAAYYVDSAINRLHCNMCGLHAFNFGMGPIKLLADDEETVKAKIVESMISRYNCRNNLKFVADFSKSLQLSNIRRDHNTVAVNVDIISPLEFPGNTWPSILSHERFAAENPHTGAISTILLSRLVERLWNWIIEESPRTDQVAKEMEEFKVFRSVHIEGNGAIKVVWILN